MAAITWRNVSGPTGAAELNALAGASRQIGGAFDGLQNALVNYQKEEGRQFEQRKTDNTNQFLNALHSQYRTPEELDAAIKSGAVNQLQAQYGNEINHEQVRGAADSLLATRRDQTRAGNEYEDQIRDRADHDLMQKAMAHVAGGGKAADVLGSLEGTRKFGDYSKVLQDAERGNIRFEWDAQNQTWGIREKQANINQSNAAANASRVSAANSADANRRANELHGYKVDELKTSAADRNEIRAGEQLAARVSMDYAAQQAEAHRKMADLARSANIPVTDGRVNFMALKGDQQDKLKALAADAGLNVEQVFAGDTAMQQAVVDQIMADKNMSVLQKQAALKNVNLSTESQARRGNDAAADARRKAVEEAEQKAWAGVTLAPQTEAEMQQYNDIISKWDKGRKDTSSWYSPWKDRMGNGAYEAVLNEGIKLDDGTRYLPAPAEFEAMLGSIEASGVRFDSQEVANVLREWANKKENIEKAKKASKYFSTNLLTETEEKLKKSQSKK